MDFLPLEKTKRVVMSELPPQWEEQIEEVYGDLDARIEDLLENVRYLTCQNQALKEMILASLGLEQGKLLIAKARSIEEEY